MSGQADEGDNMPKQDFLVSLFFGWRTPIPLLPARIISAPPSPVKQGGLYTNTKYRRDGNYHYLPRVLRLLQHAGHHPCTNTRAFLL